MGRQDGLRDMPERAKAGCDHRRLTGIVCDRINRNLPGRKIDNQLLETGMKPGEYNDSGDADKPRDEVISGMASYPLQKIGENVKKAGQNGICIIRNRN